MTTRQHAYIVNISLQPWLPDNMHQCVVCWWEFSSRIRLNVKLVNVSHSEYFVCVLYTPYIVVLCSCCVFLFIIYYFVYIVSSIYRSFANLALSTFMFSFLLCTCFVRSSGAPLPYRDLLLSQSQRVVPFGSGTGVSLCISITNFRGNSNTL